MVVAVAVAVAVALARTCKGAESDASQGGSSVGLHEMRDVLPKQWQHTANPNLGTCRSSLDTTHHLTHSHDYRAPRAAANLLAKPHRNLT